MFPHMKEVPAHFPSPSPILKEFRFSDLKKATISFSPDLILGEGGFGKVFLGWVEENTLAPSKQGVGKAVAVKRFHSGHGVAQWQAEVNFLGHLTHPNIIRLLGYCREELEHLLVYEYMPNKSFDSFLFSDTAEPLSWGTRLLIMMGAVRGMTHLHSNNIVSRGLKSSNILLDKDFNAKLEDFGLVRKCGSETGETHVTTRVMGTSGYAAPEYITTGHLTAKCDIYGLGVVLLESITGRKAMNAQRPKGQQELVEWATRVGPNLKKIMDPRLEGNYPQHLASEYVAVALRCVAPNPKHRPSGEEVLQSLEQIYAKQNITTSNRFQEVKELKSNRVGWISGLRPDAQSNSYVTKGKCGSFCNTLQA